MRFALLKHDAAIANAALRQLKQRRGDLLTVLIVLPLLAVIGRAWLSGLPVQHRDLVTYGASALIMAVLSKALIERVWFHQTDGALAHFAQRSGERLNYILPLLAAGIVLSLTAMAVIGILHPRGAMLGLSSGLATGFATPFVIECARRWWRGLNRKRARALRKHPRALIIGFAVSAAIGTICAVLPQEKALDAIGAGAYGLAVTLLIGRVDADIVRYMTVMGHSPTSLLRRWLPLQLALLLPFAAVLLLAQSWVAASVAALFALGLPAFTALRIFAYRAFTRLIADWVVAIVIFAAGYIALAFPPLGPVIIIATIVWLARRGSTARWLLT